MAWQRVVVGFDGSPAALDALRWAVEEARVHDAELVALTVTRPGNDRPALIASLRQAVEDATAARPARFEVRPGEAAAELPRWCAVTDLLVVGSRGQNPVTGLLLGSVSRACLDRASCPVAVVRGPVRARRLHTVVVGVDGSEHSRVALRTAADEARLRGDVVHAVHAVHWDHLGTELMAPSTQQLVGWGKQLVAGELAATGVAARAVVVPGRAAEVLARHSAEADLLVLGARGRSRLLALLLGSTSDHCARHALCPVLIVRVGG